METLLTLPQQGMDQLTGWLAANPQLCGWFTMGVRFVFPVLALLILLRQIRSLLTPAWGPAERPGSGRNGTPRRRCSPEAGPAAAQSSAGAGYRQEARRHCVPRGAPGERSSP